MPDTRALPCKCCGAPAPWFGQADTAKSCEARTRVVFPPTGVLVDYYRCGACGFLFSDFIDGWSPERLRRDIYNDDYVKVDPEITGARAVRVADIVEQLCGTVRQTIQIFDYGGGTGGLTAELRRRSYGFVDGGDPFFADGISLPRDVDLVLCVEVLEHLARPAEAFAAARAALKPAGMMFVTTLLQPPRIAALGTAWWYLAPRNGHVSLHSAESLRLLAHQHCFELGSINETLHLAWRGEPAFAARAIARLRAASPGAT